MISTESRMRENRTSGLTSGGEETLLRKRLRHRHKAKAAGNSYSLDLRQNAPPLDSTGFRVHAYYQQVTKTELRKWHYKRVETGNWGGTQTIILRTPPGAGSIPRAS